MSSTPGRGRGDARDARGHQVGRGYQGRSGRGNFRAPARTGTCPEIGAYLDINLSREVDPGWVTKWMTKMSEYSMSKFDSKIHLIFGQNGTLGDYPALVEPDQPEDEASRVTMKIWETDFVEWRKATLRLEQDKGKLFGIMLGQMSDTSKNRVKETEDGSEAIETNNPLQLLSAIISTHMADNRLGAEHNAFKVGKKFRDLVMEPKESLSSYHQKFMALYSGLTEAYRRADEEMDTSNFHEGQMALQFTLGLSADYSTFKQYYEDSVKPWPETVSEAFFEASKFKPRSGGQFFDGAGRANAFAMRGRFGGRGREGRGGRGRAGGQRTGSAGQTREQSSAATTYGTRKGECHHCGEEGHYSYECRSQSGKGSAGGYDNTPTKQKGK